MKQLTQTFNEIAEANPNLSSFICYQRACIKLKLSKEQVVRNFNKFVEREDYNKSITQSLIDHIFARCG